MNQLVPQYREWAKCEMQIGPLLSLADKFGGVPLVGLAMGKAPKPLQRNAINIALRRQHTAVPPTGVDITEAANRIRRWIDSQDRGRVGRDAINVALGT